MKSIESISGTSHVFVVQFPILCEDTCCEVRSTNTSKSKGTTIMILTRLAEPTIGSSQFATRGYQLK